MILTHISLASLFWHIGKQCRPRSDAPKIGNGLIQWIGMDGHTRRVKYYYISKKLVLEQRYKGSNKAFRH